MRKINFCLLALLALTTSFAYIINYHDSGKSAKAMRIENKFWQNKRCAGTRTLRAAARTSGLQAGWMHLNFMQIR